MRFSALFMAALPALALGQQVGEDGSTTLHVVSTATLTKTIFLAAAEITPLPHSNSTATFEPTRSATKSETDSDSEETNPPVKGNDEEDAALTLGAGNLVFAGLAGMAAVALL